jgi:kinesin family member 18/19
MEMKIACFLVIVFAYGATGAGKTHTMLGTGENPGIIFLTVMELYRRMDELRSTKKFEVSVSYLEVILK